MDQRQNKLDLRQRSDLIKERSFRRGNFTLASGKAERLLLRQQTDHAASRGREPLAELIVDELRDVIGRLRRRLGDGRRCR